MTAPATILIVDDNASHRKLLHELMVSLGYNPILANRGDDVMKNVYAHSPDLILLDIEMPGMDGLDVLSRLKEGGQLGSIPVIMLSAVDETDTVVECMKMGAVDYIVKPIDSSILKEKLSAHLRKDS